MPDLKPPHLVADERVTLLTLIQYQRDSFLRKVAGVDEGRARQNPVVSGTNLAVATYKEVWRQVNGVIAAAPSLDEVCHDVGGEVPVNLRWVLMHLLEETARHAGHDDILRYCANRLTGPLVVSRIAPALAT